MGKVAELLVERKTIVYTDLIGDEFALAFLKVAEIESECVAD